MLTRIGANTTDVFWWGIAVDSSIRVLTGAHVAVWLVPVGLTFSKDTTWLVIECASVDFLFALIAGEAGRTGTFVSFQ
jgi:hypothetical protein